VDNNIILRGELDLIEEKRNAAQLRVSCYQQKVAKYYNSKVQGRQFKVGDLVLRNSATSDPHNVRKLSPNWEGPYRVKAVIKDGAYHLEQLDGTPITRSWNISNLRRFYQ